MKKILVIQTAFLGDVIMSTPIFKGLKTIYPDVKIDVVVTKQNKDILKNNPHINEIIVFNKKNIFDKIVNMIRLIYRFRKTRYGLAVSVQGSFTSSLLMILSGISKRVGFYRQKLLTNPVSIPKGLHIRERVGLLLQELKRSEYDLDTELFTSRDDRNKMDEIVKKEGNFRLGIAPGSIRETKKWPYHYFIALLNELPYNIDVYLIGGPGDINLAQQILSRTINKNIQNTIGSLSLLESTELISRMDLMLTNDSAPLHMANAVNTPVFAFFGPTVRRFGCYPYREKDRILEVDLYCRPCGKHGEKRCPEKHFKCMKNLTPSFVLENIKQFMDDHEK
ncbi:lipopolysaccharide heptosyltransferase II [candidate division KSB1 bacterium]|nr:lipopolysaccharide heptosyltransferase II [candidate division KSB1 bacterium]